MKTILLPTDFSPQSMQTLEYVIKFFGDTKIPCNILLLNTYMVQQTDPEQVIFHNDLLKNKSKHGLEIQRHEALKNNLNHFISVDIASHMGSLNHVVLQLLKKLKVDMVAMGKDGGRHVEMLAPLLKQEQCPLLIC
jgi:hypothetical protein